MVADLFYNHIANLAAEGKKMLAILVDPEKFDLSKTQNFLQKIPQNTTHLFVGGSTDLNGELDVVVDILKNNSAYPIIIFPGSFEQFSNKADAILFLSLLSGRNAEYLIGHQIKAVPKIKKSLIEVISTAYILIDGGNESAVSRITSTKPIPQTRIEEIVNTALAGQYMGAKLIYLEAGSGAKNPVNAQIIFSVKKAIHIPLIVGGGIRTEAQKQDAYKAGADMVVMGTVFEEIILNVNNKAVG